MSKKNIEIPASRKSFVINSEHADMIVNDLMQGDYEALGRLFTDLVNLNVHGTMEIVENAGSDKAERTARRLLKSDSEHYISSFRAKSEQNAKNRTAGQQPSREEIIDYAKARGYIRNLEDEQIVVSWAMEQAQRDWTDQNGAPIRYWKKTLDAYMVAVLKKKTADALKYGR